MLIPSFCRPPVAGPNPAITRPLAGQRNFGSAPVASATFPGSLPEPASTTGANTLALGAVSDSGAGSCNGAGLTCATADGALAPPAPARAADVRTPGMTRRSPTLSLAAGARL